MRPTALLPVWGNDAFERAVSTQPAVVPTGERGDLHHRSCALHGLIADGRSGRIDRGVRPVVGASSKNPRVSGNRGAVGGTS